MNFQIAGTLFRRAPHGPALEVSRHITPSSRVYTGAHLFLARLSPRVPENSLMDMRSPSLEKSPHVGQGDLAQSASNLASPDFFGPAGERFFQLVSTGVRSPALEKPALFFDPNVRISWQEERPASLVIRIEAPGIDESVALTRMDDAAAQSLLKGMKTVFIGNQGPVNQIAMGPGLRFG